MFTYDAQLSAHLRSMQPAPKAPADKAPKRAPKKEATMGSHQGTIVKWITERDFGFATITSPAPTGDDDVDIFVGGNSVKKSGVPPVEAG